MNHDDRRIMYMAPGAVGIWNLKNWGEAKKHMHNWVSILVSRGQEGERREAKWRSRVVGPKKRQKSLLVSESRKLQAHCFAVGGIILVLSVSPITLC